MRGKTSLISACVVLCAAAGAVCGGEKTVTNKRGGFEISLPGAWCSLDTSGGTVAQNADGFFSVQIVDVKEGAGLRSCFGIGWVKDLLRSGVLTGIQLCKIETRPALKIELGDAGPHGNGQFTFYYVVAGTRGYTILCSAKKSEFDTHVKDFDAIVNSFKVLTDK